MTLRDDIMGFADQLEAEPVGPGVEALAQLWAQQLRNIVNSYEKVMTFYVVATDLAKNEEIAYLDGYEIEKANEIAQECWDQGLTNVRLMIVGEDEA